MRRPERWWRDTLALADGLVPSPPFAPDPLRNRVECEIIQLERDRRARALRSLARRLLRRSVPGLAAATLDLIAPLVDDADDVLRRLLSAESGRLVSRMLRDRLGRATRTNDSPTSSESPEAVLFEFVRVVEALCPGFESAVVRVEFHLVFYAAECAQALDGLEALVSTARFEDAARDQLDRVRLAWTAVFDPPRHALAALERSPLAREGSASFDALDATLRFAAGEPSPSKAVHSPVAGPERARIARFLAARSAEASNGLDSNGRAL